MSWFTVIWSINSGVCLTLAAVYLVVWIRNRSMWRHLAFSLWALAVAVTAVFEVAMIHARTPQEYGEIMRWIYVPIGVSTAAFTCFVRLYLRAGRIWILWTFYGLLALSLVVNFIMAPNAYVSEITSLEHIPVLGEVVAIPTVVVSPWNWLNRLKAGWIVLFVVDAIILSRRQGGGRQTAFMGWAFVCSSAGYFTLSEMTALGDLTFAVTASIAYLAPILIMGYALGREHARSRQMSQELKRNRERMQLAATAARFTIWEWDLARDNIRFQETGGLISGFDSTLEMDSSRLLELVHPDDRERVRKLGQRVSEGMGDFELEYRIVSAGGRTVWVQSMGMVESDSGGTPRYVRGVSIDVTERRKMASLLEKSEAHLLRAQEIANSGSWELDLVTGGLTWSEEVYRIFEVTGSQPLSYEEFLKIVPPEDRPYVEGNWQAALEGRPYDIEHRILAGDGVKWVREKAEVEFDEGGRPLRGIGIVQDITDRKRVEKTLQDYQQHLKALASQLTLSEERTRQALAADLHDHVGHSLALARMQLGGILESDSALETRILVKDISAILLKALEETRQLIFDLAPKSLEHFGLGPAISEWLEERIGKLHRLTFEFSNDLPAAVDREMGSDVKVLLFRSVRELLTNVVKHADAKRVAVRLSSNEHSVVLVVEDDGNGFEYQMSDEDQHAGDGFGLLSIRTRMINLMGSFDIQSSPGKGCRVEMTAPLDNGNLKKERASTKNTKDTERKQHDFK